MGMLMEPRRSFYLYILSIISAFALGFSQEDSWAQRTLQNMSQEEKIGQLFMIAGYVDPEFANKEIGNRQIIQDIDHFITQYHIGGITFVGPSEYAKQIVLTNHYQNISKYPLLIAQDLEWGLSMRIKDAMGFPKNTTLGEIEDNSLIYAMGKEIAHQAKLIGVHMNLSPVMDVNIDPDNIVINVRSFGNSPQNVAEKGIAMIQGLQDTGMIASAKHFPGLGDISTDPHLGLPYCPHKKERLQKVELFPFTQAIKAGVLSIQTDHLLIPALEPDSQTPSSLSPKVVNDLLKKQLGFTGLVISGALRMKALAKHLSDEEITLKAFLAGSDMLLMPQDLPRAYQTLKAALADGKFTETDLNERVLKILQLKEKVKLDQQRIVDVPAKEQLNSSSAKELKRKLYWNAVKITRNKNNLVPLSVSNRNTIAYIQLGDAPTPTFLEILSKRTTLDSFIFPLDKGVADEQQRLLQQIGNYSLIIIAVYPADPRRIVEIRNMNEKQQKEELKDFRVHGLPQALINVAKALEHYQDKIVVAYFGNPFGLHFFDDYSTLIMAHEPDPDAQEAAFHLLFSING